MEKLRHWIVGSFRTLNFKSNPYKYGWLARVYEKVTLWLWLRSEQYLLGYCIYTLNIYKYNNKIVRDVRYFCNFCIETSDPDNDYVGNVVGVSTYTTGRSDVTWRYSKGRAKIIQSFLSTKRPWSPERFVVGKVLDSEEKRLAMFSDIKNPKREDLKECNPNYKPRAKRIR